MLINANNAVAGSALLTPETPPRLCARQLILERVAELAKHEGGTRAGEEIEALHDMRVASRRLREALEIFQFCFPPKIYDRLYARVRRITRALGQARNADVAVDYFAKLLAGSHQLIEQVALQDLLRRLVKQQARLRKEMQDELDEVQPANLLPRFEKAFDNLPPIPASRQRGSRTALQLARRLFAQRLHEVFACYRLVQGEGDVEGLHNVRIAVKKLRYALETLDFAAGEHVKENLKFFKKLQTVLGDLHDRDVFLEITQKRLNKLQKQAFADHLLSGYQPVVATITSQRRDFYANYVKLFGQAKIQDWRPRIVPPLRKKTSPVSVPGALPVYTETAA
ncbi:MAG: CHAD domain-containing protein [candidate division KSB1 bacterium]|nr:CHAD domain-containing protein [candidate division KSB1 bacterium]MDZ7367786.1 CHAD domain-containing protein [candidate division KSB1 bacterium]MDZ7406623.1 CHAD domain-containing protein [candidate division KSB1 bacterium]